MVTQPKRSAYGWSFVMSGGQAAINIASSFVLAALIGPESYGVVAMALVYVMLIQVLLRQGLGAALVQREHLSVQDLRTVFVILSFLILVLTSVSVALSGWWANVNNLPRLREIIVALSLLLPIRGLIVIPDAILRREMRFKALAARANLGALAGGFAGITLALFGVGVWALVVQQLVGASIELIVLIAMSRWKPQLGFDIGFAREMLRFSSGTFLASLGGFVVLRADAILMGIFFGPLAVGLFRFAIRLVDTLVGAVATALQNVALPILSGYRTDPDRFAKELGRLYAAAALVAWPALGIIAGSAQGLIRLLGDEWSDAVTPIRLLAIAGAGSALSFMTSAVLTSLGFPHRYAAIAWVSGLMNLAALVGVGLLLEDKSVSTQIIGVAIVNIVLHAGINLAIYLWASIHVTTLRLQDILQRLLAPFVAGISAAGVGSVVGSSEIVSGVRKIPYLITTTGSSTVAAAGMLILLTPNGVRGIVHILRPGMYEAEESG